MRPKRRPNKGLPPRQQLGARDGRQHRGRLATEAITLRADIPLSEWLKDRGAILGIPYTTMCRDVLAVWKELVCAAEQEAGIVLDAPEYRHEHDKIIVPERIPGYRDALLPKGNRLSHLDDAPLSVKEML